MRRPNAAEKAYLVVWTPSRRAPAATAFDSEAALAELQDLATSAGARVCGVAVQRAARPDPAMLIGRGKAGEIRGEARAAGADLVIFDHNLSPTQLRNLEQVLEVKVIDRTELILDIFARRARSREGQLQVELAQLNYLLPRLSGRGTLLSRLGGGIGTRGPGEQQLEYDRRRIRGRIRKLTEALERVRSERRLHRARRREQKFQLVALVGYTNAGKSTLFNALAGAEAFTSPKLFATLDPTVRHLPLPSRRPALVSDTVGFIRDLPANLVTAFRATLEELEEADLLLHVTDSAHPERNDQRAAVEKILESLGLAGAPRLQVWNKIDLLEESERKRLPLTKMEVAVSARTGEGLEALAGAIDHALGESEIEAVFELAASDSDRLAKLYRLGKVLSSEQVDGSIVVRARLSRSLCEQLDLPLKPSADPSTSR